MENVDISGRPLNLDILFIISWHFFIALQLLKSEVGVEKKIIQNQSLNQKIPNPLEMKQNSNINTTWANEIISQV